MVFGPFFFSYFIVPPSLSGPCTAAMSRPYPDLGYASNANDDVDERPAYDDEFDDDDVKPSLPVAGRKGQMKKGIRYATSQTTLPQNATPVESSTGFEAVPSVVHYGGWTAGKEYVQEISVKNATRKPLRFQIYPPVSAEFSIQYEKQGTLAPGMSQKIWVKFSSNEYKYCYDCLSVQGEGDTSLLVPLHAYPITNKVYFPKLMDFGSIPLCEPAVRVRSVRLDWTSGRRGRGHFTSD